MLQVKAGTEVRLTVDPTVEASASRLPITYPLFTQLVEPGDTVFVGRCVPVMQAFSTCWASAAVELQEAFLLVGTQTCLSWT